MASREIILWLDERWYKALSQQLGEDAVEARLNQYMEQLIQQLPQDQREKISGEIQREDQQWQEFQESMRYFSIYRVKEHGIESCFQLENTPSALLNAAHNIRRYLRQKPGWEADSYADLFSKWEPITAEKFDQMAELHMENPEKVTDVYDLDFDKQEFSAADPQDGWQTYSMKDISTAAYHAFRNGNASYEQRCERIADCLRGKEISSPGHLSLKEISLAEEICEMDGQRLNFYLETSFDVDAVFGTHVCTAENDDTLNVYVDYDMATGQVCDELEVDLHRADGREKSVEYRLNAVEKAILLRKMEDYCLQQTGQSLKDYSAALMAEEEIVPPTGPTL